MVKRNTGAKAGKAQPPLLGAIDVGSTSVRMDIAELLPNGPPHTIEELTYPVMTGTDTFRLGHIRPETMRAICGVLKNFTHLLDDYGVRTRRTVCTAAVREASNREIVADRIRHESGLELEILDAVEESRLAYQALMPWLRDGSSLSGYTMAVNLGGGSTEIMMLRGEDLQVGGTRRLGTARLSNAVGTVEGGDKTEVLEIITQNIMNSTRDVYREYHATRFLLINRLLFRAFHSHSAARHGERDFVIPVEVFRRETLEAAKLGPVQLGRKFNLGMADVELLVPAMMILSGFLNATEINEITLTNTELISGLLLEMAMEARGEKPLMTFHRQIVRSARAIGEKYEYDRAHARLVTEFALRIFTAIASHLDLFDHDCLLLEVAAVLHDIGMFVGERHHHRHSAYLVRWSDIVGLNETDRLMVTEIVRFHRKDIPSSQHAEFMALSPENRMRVRKLAAILRVADALDRGHRQQVKDVMIEIRDEKLHLLVNASGDLGAVSSAIPEKANLLEQVMGMPVILLRHMPMA